MTERDSTPDSQAGTGGRVEMAEAYNGGPAPWRAVAVTPDIEAGLDGAGAFTLGDVTRASAQGYDLGYDHGWRARGEDLAALHLQRHAAKIVVAGARELLGHPDEQEPARHLRLLRHLELVTTTDDELRAAATERERRGIERFRADHAARRARETS